MAKIHNGYFNKRFHDSFKDTGLNDTDIATTKFYVGVKPMYRHLGFTTTLSDIPDNQYYWKNIIPKNFTLLNRTGITLKEGRDPMDGAKTPREFYQEYEVDPTDSQDWYGDYHYPVIPKLNKFGVIGDYEPGNMKFGQKETWNGDDDNAPITNPDEQNPDLIMNINFDDNTTDGITDRIKLFDVNYNRDYPIGFDRNFRLERKGRVVKDSLETNTDEQVY